MISCGLRRVHRRNTHDLCWEPKAKRSITERSYSPVRTLGSRVLVKLTVVYDAEIFLGLYSAISLRVEKILISL
jgi:hypothetical protein